MLIRRNTSGQQNCWIRYRLGWLKGLLRIELLILDGSLEYLLLGLSFENRLLGELNLLTLRSGKIRNEIGLGMVLNMASAEVCLWHLLIEVVLIWADQWHDGRLRGQLRLNRWLHNDGWGLLAKALGLRVIHLVLMGCESMLMLLNIAKDVRLLLWG